MKFKFKKEEDIEIINAYIQNGFTLTQKVCEELVKTACPTRNVKAIRNRFYRTLNQQYKGFLDKNYHIRIQLRKYLAEAILKDNAQQEAQALVYIANKFCMPTKKVAKIYYNGDECWSKEFLMTNMQEVPNTNVDMVNMYLEKEDSVLHLFDDVIASIKESANTETKKQEKKMTFWQKLKNIFKCKNS